jgi:putative DNA primase/helicase
MHDVNSPALHPQGQNPSNGQAGQPPDLLQAALAYAALGLRVVPLHHIISEKVCSCPKGAGCGRKTGKHPRFVAWQRLATTDPATIRRWWARWPAANVGIATGEGVLVLDVDPDKGGDVCLVGLQAARGMLPRTVACRTGGGGRHLYFRVAGPCGNRVGFLPGLDVRAEGGLVVAPPSRHRLGGCYEWLRPPDTTVMAEAPHGSWTSSLPPLQATAAARRSPPARHLPRCSPRPS